MLPAAILLVVVSFGVGWVVSGSDEHTGVGHPPAVTRLKPLPVPRVIIPNGPWADPRPTRVAPVRTPPHFSRGLLDELRWLLGLDPLSGVRHG